MSQRHDDEADEAGGVYLGSKYSAGDIALFRDIADAAAEKAVSHLFISMGHDPKDPLKAQADAAWTRRWRGYSEGMIGKALLTSIALGVAGAAHTAWSAIKNLPAVTGNVPPGH